MGLGQSCLPHLLFPTCVHPPPRDGDFLKVLAPDSSTVSSLGPGGFGFRPFFPHVSQPGIAAEAQPQFSLVCSLVIWSANEASRPCSFPDSWAYCPQAQKNNSIFLGNQVRCLSTHGRILAEGNGISQKQLEKRKQHGTCGQP